MGVFFFNFDFTFAIVSKEVIDLLLAKSPYIFISLPLTVENS